MTLDHNFEDFNLLILRTSIISQTRILSLMYAWLTILSNGAQVLQCGVLDLMAFNESVRRAL